MDAISQDGRMEIDQQAEVASREPQVGQHNSVMDGCNCRNGLDFENNPIEDNYVSTIATIQLVSAINNRNGLLALKRNAGTGDFKAQTFFVDGLQKAGAEFAMDCDRCSYQLVG